jgi:RNA polymerase sigma-70 factor (ECF subfamily)
MNGATSVTESSDVRPRIIAFLPRLRRFCRGLAGGDGDWGDDLLQATVERALARIEHWQPGTSLENWMFRMATNLNIDHLRSRRTRGVTVDVDDALDLAGDDELARLEQRSELAAVRAALAAMPPDLNRVLTIVVIDGQSYREAADLLDIPIGTVMSRLSRARQFVEAHVNGGVRGGPERIAAA